MTQENSIDNPMERPIAEALKAAGIFYRHDMEGNTKGLDFHLADHGLYIECKQFPTPRSEGQLERDENIILIQGRKSMEFFVSLLASRNDALEKLNRRPCYIVTHHTAGSFIHSSKSAALKMQELISGSDLKESTAISVGYHDGWATDHLPPRTFPSTPTNCLGETHD